MIDVIDIVYLLILQNTVLLRANQKFEVLFLKFYKKIHMESFLA